MVYLSNMGIQTYEEALHSVTLPPSNHFDTILAWSRSWVKQLRGETFTTEQLRAVYERREESIPAEPRVYGAVLRRLIGEGLIEPIGWEESKNKQAHKRPIRVWRIK